MTHSVFPLTRAAALFVCVGVAASLGCGGYSTGVADPSQGTVDWSGSWQTNFGPLALTTDPADPSHVTGRYAYNLQGRVVRGTVDALARGAALEVGWRDEPAGVGAGRARFVMDADRRSFVGTWGHGESETDGGEWNGERR